MAEKQRLTRVIHTPPHPGTSYFMDVVEIALPSEPHRILEPGTAYRPALPGEVPTHYPEVTNGDGTKGFVVFVPESK